MLIEMKDEVFFVLNRDNLTTIFDRFINDLVRALQRLTGNDWPCPVAPSCYSLFRALCWVAISLSATMIYRGRAHALFWFHHFQTL